MPITKGGVIIGRIDITCEQARKRKAGARGDQGEGQAEQRC